MGGGGSKGVHAYVSGQVKKMAESPDDVVVDILEGLTKMVHRPRSYRTTRYTGRAGRCGLLPHIGWRTRG